MLKFSMQKNPWKDVSVEHRKTDRLHHKVYACASAVSSPGTGPAEACSYHLKFNSNSHSFGVPGCDNTETHITADVVSLCRLFIVFTA